jgi:hypothetical protein
MTDSSNALNQGSLQSVGSDDLQLLKQGRISIEQYLERRLQIALEGLGSTVTSEQRNEIQALLRDHFLEDPALRIYAERAAHPGKSE